MGACWEGKEQAEEEQAKKGKKDPDKPPFQKHLKVVKRILGQEAAC